MREEPSLVPPSHQLKVRKLEELVGGIFLLSEALVGA